MNTKIYNFNLPNNLREYLKTKSKKKNQSISDYLINLIYQDKNTPNIIIQDENNIEIDIIKLIIYKWNSTYLATESNTEKIKTELLNIIKNLTNINVHIDCKIENQFLIINLLIKLENKEKCLNITIIRS